MNLSRSRSVLVAALVLIGAASAHSQVPPARIIMGGRAAVLVADAVYAFPSEIGRAHV